MCLRPFIFFLPFFLWFEHNKTHVGLLKGLKVRYRTTNTRHFSFGSSVHLVRISSPSILFNAFSNVRRVCYVFYSSSFRCSCMRINYHFYFCPVMCVCVCAFDSSIPHSVSEWSPVADGRYRFFCTVIIITVIWRRICAHVHLRSRPVFSCVPFNFCADFGNINSNWTVCDSCDRIHTHRNRFIRFTDFENGFRVRGARPQSAKLYARKESSKKSKDTVDADGRRLSTLIHFRWRWHQPEYLFHAIHYKMMARTRWT